MLIWAGSAPSSVGAQLDFVDSDCCVQTQDAVVRGLRCER